MDDRRFRRMDPPDEIELELWAAGAFADEPERAAAAERAAAGALADVAADLERFKAEWKGLPLPRAAPAPANTTRWYGAIVALAAAALLAVLAWTVPDRGEGLRAMGGLPVDLVVVREGSAIGAHAPLAAGDRLDLAMVAPRAGWVWVGTVQDDGHVTVLYHSPDPIAAGQRFELPGAIELDAWAGREWLVVGLTSAPAHEGLLAETLGDMLPLPGPSATTWVHEVTRER